MREFNIDEILTEASWRLKSGIVDFNTEESINTLRQVLKEHEYNPDFIDEFIFTIMNGDLITENDMSADVNDIKDALADVIEDYHKIMKVFYYFDANSVGTVSEVVLTQLLNQQSNGESFPYSAKHTGAANELADIVLQKIDSKDDVIQISLKTTSEAEGRIGLGNAKYTREFDWTKYFADLHELQSFFVENVDGHTFNELKSKYGEMYPDMIDFFQSRIDSIIYKLSEIAFFWSAINSTVVKGTKEKILNGFTFIIGNFYKNTLETLLKDKCNISAKKPPTGKFSEFSWGLSLIDGKDMPVIAELPQNSKYLNVSSTYIKNKFLKGKSAVKSPSTGKISVQTIPDEIGKFHIIKANINLSTDALKNSNISADVKKNLIQILLKNISDI